MMTPEISVVVLSWNTADLLVACLRSLDADDQSGVLEVIVVDNASADGSADRVAAEFPGVRLIRNEENLLYAEGNNIGARAATGEYLCLLNSDTEVTPGALGVLRDFLRDRPRYAMVGPKLLNRDGSLQKACRRLPRLREQVWQWSWFRNTRWARRANQYAAMTDFDHLTSRDVEQPLGACVMLCHQEYLSMEGLDPQLSLFFDDVDFSLRLKEKNRGIYYLVDAVVMHHHGASTKQLREEFGNVLWNRNRLAFVRKHHGWLAGCLIRGMFHTTYASMFLRVVCSRRSWTDKRATLGRLRSFGRRSTDTSPL